MALDLTRDNFSNPVNSGSCVTLHATAQRFLRIPEPSGTILFSAAKPKTVPKISVMRACTPSWPRCLTILIDLTSPRNIRHRIGGVSLVQLVLF